MPAWDNEQGTETEIQEHGSSAEKLLHTHGRMDGTARNYIPLSPTGGWRDNKGKFVTSFEKINRLK